MANSIRFVFLVLFIVGFQPSTFAQEKAAALKKLSKGADVIVTGKVTHKNSTWNENKSRIYTRATLEVDEYLKGKANGKSVEIVYPGGEVGDVGELYTHMPTFEKDEEVLVFLKKEAKSNDYKVLHGEEGKIKVINDPKSKQKLTSINQPVKALKSEIRKILNEQ